MYLTLIGLMELFSNESFQGRMESDYKIHTGIVLDSCRDWLFIKGHLCGKRVVLCWWSNAPSAPWPSTSPFFFLGKI